MSVEVHGRAINPKTTGAPEAGGVVTVPSDTTPVPTYTESQLGFQRLLLREKRSEALPGDVWKRLRLAVEVGGAATMADLAESHLIDVLWRNPMDRMVEHARDHISQDAAKTRQGVKFAGEFIEEWASDSAYTAVANAWLRMMTGIKEVKYVTETSAFIADWVNVISQVWLQDKLYPTKFVGDNGKPMRGWLGIKKAYQTMDFVNPVNVEAALRALEEAPVVGTAITWLHEKTDSMLESKTARFGNAAVAKGILGFHIGRNVKPL